jgi:Tfp pilus assembly protein PilF
MNERIEKLMAFLKDSPKDLFLNHALALEYVKTGHDVEARERFEQNINTEPGYIATYYHLGKLLERAGQNPEAMVIYEKGMKAAKSAGDMHTYNELQGAYDELAY